MTGQERLHSRVQEEAQEDPARGTQDHDESHQRPSGAADLEMPEVTPVDLGLFAGKRAQPQVSLGLGARPMAGDHMTEVIGVTPVSSLVNHAVEPCGGQGREGLQGLEDEGQIGIDLAGAAWWSVGSQPATSQGEANGVAVDAKLAGDGSRAPLLNMIIA